MNIRSPILDADLHAFVDGEATDDLRARVQSYLGANMDAARRVASWSLQADGLREAFPLPVSNLKETATTPVQTRSSTSRAIYLLSLVLAFMTGIAVAVTFYIVNVMQPVKATTHAASDPEAQSSDLRGS